MTAAIVSCMDLLQPGILSYDGGSFQVTDKLHMVFDTMGNNKWMGEYSLLVDLHACGVEQWRPGEEGCGHRIGFSGFVLQWTTKINGLQLRTG